MYYTLSTFCFIIIYDKLYFIIILLSRLWDFQDLLILFLVEGIEIGSFIEQGMISSDVTYTGAHSFPLVWDAAQLGTVLVGGPYPHSKAEPLPIYLL